MAAKRCSPSGTSSVITPRILLCRPWTLTSQSTLGNHLLPHTSQNKDCRGFSDAHSWHVEQELTVNEHSFRIVLCKQRVLKIRETWNKGDLARCSEISVTNLLLRFMLMTAYHKTIPISSKHVCPPGQSLVLNDNLLHSAKVNVWMSTWTTVFLFRLFSAALSDIKTCSTETSATVQKQTGWCMRKQTSSWWGYKQVDRQVERQTSRKTS